MILRPKHLVRSKISLQFNGFRFSEIEVDLEHVNQNKRSKLEVEDIEEILKSWVEQRFYSSAGEKKFGNEICTYYVVRKKYKAKPYKLVLCICSDKPSTLGVITFYREDL